MNKHILCFKNQLENCLTYKNAPSHRYGDKVFSKKINKNSMSRYMENNDEEGWD